MTKRLLIIPFVASLMLISPMSSGAADAEPQVVQQVDEREITITVSQSSIIVNNAAGLTLEVVSLTGKQVAKVRIDSPAQRVELNIPKGCYIVKVGKVVRKISIC